MTKVTGINELAQYIEYNEMVRNHSKKAERELKKQKIAEMVASGVDKEIAKVMVNAMWECGC